MEKSKSQMMIDIEYKISHSEGDTSYRVVRIGDVLQYIKENDDSFCDMPDIEFVHWLFDNWDNYKYDLSSQSEVCISEIHKYLHL